MLTLQQSRGGVALRQLNVDGGILDVTEVTDLSYGESEVKYMPEGKH